MILLLGAISPPLMRYAFSIGKELSFYKLTKYLIADNAISRAFQENKMNEFIDILIKDLPRRFCMDKRKRLSLRSNVRLGNSYFNELEMMELNANVA